MRDPHNQATDGDSETPDPGMEREGKGRSRRNRRKKAAANCAAPALGKQTERKTITENSNKRIKQGNFNKGNLTRNERGSIESID